MPNCGNEPERGVDPTIQIENRMDLAADFALLEPSRISHFAVAAMRGALLVTPMSEIDNVHGMGGLRAIWA